MDSSRYLGSFSHLFCLVAVVLFLAGCSNSTEPNPQEFSKKSVDNFFKIMRSSGLREAYYSTHPLFQANTTYRTLLELDTIYGFKQNEGIELLELSSDKKNIVSMSGNVNLADSLIVPFKAKFSSDKNSVGVNPWKIIYIEFNMKKYFENQGMVVPDNDAMLSLSKRYFLLFQGELKRLQLKGFYDSCSKFWKSKISLEQMERVFQPFINDRFLTQDFRTANFELNYQSGLRDTGILVISGNIIGLSKIQFYMEFFFELGQFRPINFNLKQL